MKSIAILFSGEGSNLKYLVENMHNKDLLVKVVITNKKEAKGIDVAKMHNIPCSIIDSSILSRDAFDYLLVEELNKYNLDLTVLAGFMRVLTPHFVENIRSINLHPSLLPKHKGLNAIENSYNDDSSVGGISVHYVEEELDAGNIILQEKVLKENLSLDEYSLIVKHREKILLNNAIKKVLNIDF